MPSSKHYPIPMRLFLYAMSILGSWHPTESNAATPTQGIVYLSALAGPGSLYRVDFQYDGASSLTVSTPQRLATLLQVGGGLRLGPDHFVYVVGGGEVYRVDPDNGAYTHVNSGNNANIGSFDPSGNLLWAGWQNSTLSSVPIDPLATGSPHAMSGDDSIVTTVAFSPANGVFYTTGADFDSGNFGRVDMTTFVTQRLLSNARATGVIYDGFSGHLIVAGVGRAKQIAPANPSVVLSSRDDSVAGENYLMLQADGRGHLFGTRFGPAARLVMIDYSASGLIGAADTVMLSVPLPGLTGLSGEAAVDPNSIFKNGFETPVP
jgi:hypothetical protein